MNLKDLRPIMTLVLLIIRIITNYTLNPRIKTEGKINTKITTLSDARNSNLNKRKTGASNKKLDTPTFSLLDINQTSTLEENREYSIKRPATKFLTGLFKLVIT
jgi:hypothetical protein